MAKLCGFFFVLVARFPFFMSPVNEIYIGGRSGYVKLLPSVQGLGKGRRNLMHMGEESG